MSSILLLCAVLASLTFGVLVAYWMCQAMFAVFRVHSQQVQARRVVHPARAVGGQAS